MKRRSFNRGPISMFAKFNSVCAETGKPIAKGDSFILWDGKAYSHESKHGDEYRALEFASNFDMADSNY